MAAHLRINYFCFVYVCNLCCFVALVFVVDDGISIVQLWCPTFGLWRERQGDIVRGIGYFNLLICFFNLLIC